MTATHTTGMDATGAPAPVATATRSTIGCLIPARSESATISLAIESILGQSRLPDVIHVIVNNSDDDTAAFAAEFAGPHIRVIDGVEQFTSLYVHNVGTPGVAGTRSGALDYGFTLIEGYDYFFVLDGDTVAGPDEVAQLENAIVAGAVPDGVRTHRGLASRAQRD